MTRTLRPDDRGAFVLEARRSGQTYASIARTLGVTVERVRQLHRKAATSAETHGAPMTAYALRDDLRCEHVTEAGERCRGARSRAWRDDELSRLCWRHRPDNGWYD